MKRNLKKKKKIFWNPSNLEVVNEHGLRSALGALSTSLAAGLPQVLIQFGVDRITLVRPLARTSRT
jgi:hypothetical protein